MKMRAEIDRSMQQAKEYQGWPVDQEKLEGKRGTNASLAAQKEPTLPHLDLGLEASEPQTIHFYCLVIVSCSNTPLGSDLSGSSACRSLAKASVPGQRWRSGLREHPES